MLFNRRLSVCLAALAAAGLVASCAAGASRWKDGAWQGRAEGAHGDVVLTVTVQKGKIAAITVDQQQEAAGVSDAAFTRVPQEIIQRQSTKVDVVSGASLSSKAIMAAAENALAKATK